MRRTSVVAAALLGIVLAGAVTALVAGLASGWPMARLNDVLVFSNVALGLCLALAGWPIATHRPRNPVGWLLLGGGIAYVTTGAGMPLLAVAGTGSPLWRVVATVTSGAWSWALTLFLPLALLYFPDGRLPSPRWRWLVGVAAVAGVLGCAAGVTSGFSSAAGVRGYLVVESADRLSAVAFGLLPAVYLGAVVALVRRYRAGDDRVRRQLLWVLTALLVVVVIFALDPVLPDTLLSILPVALIPAAILVAILRHGLLDIRLVFSRSLLYVLLTGAAVGLYLGAVALAGPSVLVTLLIAVAFNPARVWLQQRIDRLVYGSREDPARALAAVGAELGDAAGMDDVLRALCETLRLPYAGITAHGAEVATHGVAPAAVAVLALPRGAGELTVGLRAGEKRLSAADERVLTLLAAPVAVACEANGLAADLARSREQTISAREEERRRLRRDLHDGLGPVLTSVVLNAEAARRLLRTDPGRSETLLGDLRDRTTGALGDIRRLVYDLRPPALDSLGLRGALTEYAMVLSRRADGQPLRITVIAPEPLDELPAAVEVAGYRIVTEALTNVARHSTAGAVTVLLARTDGELRVAVHDDGVNAGHGPRAGVGLTSIRERAAELGGRCTIVLDRAGGRIDVRIPVTALRMARTP